MLLTVILFISILSLAYIGWQFRDVAFNDKPYQEFFRDPKIWISIAWLIITIIAVLYAAYSEVAPYV